MKNETSDLVNATTLAAPGIPWMLYIVLLALFIAVLWIFWNRRPASHRGKERLLSVTESCALGPRQFLIVAAYEKKRVLLAVSPGRTDFLCHLNEDASLSPKPEFHEYLDQENPS